MKYRKKPVVIEAEVYKPGMEDGIWCQRYRKDCDEVDTSVDSDCDKCKSIPYIDTLEGPHMISPGDYIITGVEGERYPCKPDIFKQTYELVNGSC